MNFDLAAFGLGFYGVAVYAAILVVVIIFLIGMIERWIPRNDRERDET